MQAISGRRPDVGDILWIDFDPARGHEQAGRRPALVVSPATYNEVSSLLLVCPVTRNDRPWPFKVALPDVDGLSGYILVDQVRSIDPAHRVLEVGGRAPPETVANVKAILAAVLGVKP